MDAECPVCCEGYTKQQRKKVECGYCGTACCSACLQKYLLTLQADAQCMGCRRAMDSEFLSMHLTKTWLLGTYKEHRERVLLEREKALLPASQDMLTNYRHALRARERIEQWEAERRQLQHRLFDLTRDIAHARDSVAYMERTNYTQRRQGGTRQGQQERRQFIRACPVDGCRGFLSTAWRCGTCETWVCKDCGEPKLEGQRDEDHVCDPNVAASHALLQRDSRPCPQCAAMIFKVEGCDQMWCTQCNVAFSWRTGAIVTNGIIHNPHYYEWLRRTRGTVPRQAGDVPCGGMPGAYELDAALRREGAAADDSRALHDIHRVLRHVQQIDLPRLRREADGGGEFQRNADLRLKYLLGQMDDQEWRKKLQQREKRRERSFAVMQVYDMFSGAATDTFRALAQGAQPAGEALAELRQLQAFANDGLASIGSRFNMCVKRLARG